MCPACRSDRSWPILFHCSQDILIYCFWEEAGRNVLKTLLCNLENSRTLIVVRANCCHHVTVFPLPITTLLTNIAWMYSPRIQNEYRHCGYMGLVVWPLTKTLVPFISHHHGLGPCSNLLPLWATVKWHFTASLPCCHAEIARSHHMPRGEIREASGRGGVHREGSRNNPACVQWTTTSA